MCKTAEALRKLAREIGVLCHDSSCMGVAAPIIDNTIDHLLAVARIHELNQGKSDANKADPTRIAD